MCDTFLGWTSFLEEMAGFSYFLGASFSGEAGLFSFFSAFEPFLETDFFCFSS